MHARTHARKRTSTHTHTWPVACTDALQQCGGRQEQAQVPLVQQVVDNTGEAVGADHGVLWRGFANEAKEGEGCTLLDHWTGGAA